MKHLKVTSVLLSVAMCVSIMTAPVIADETAASEETQVEETEKQETKETEKPAPKETEKQETEETQEEPEATEKEQTPEAEDAAEALDALASGKCGKKAKWTLSKDGVLTVSGSGAMTNYTHNTATGKTNAPWFSKKDLIKRVVIKKGITSVGAYSFFYCPQLTSVSLPSNLKVIGIAAFSSCINLKSITIPKKVTTIGAGAFASTGLLRITIPDSVKTIGEYAFIECDRLYEAKLPKGLKAISTGLFMYCELLSSVNIPNGITTIGDSAFEYTAIKNISIPVSVKTIGTRAFFGSRLETVKIPLAGLVTIKECAFQKCSGLKKIEIPLTVKTLENNAFAGCASLEEVWMSLKLKESMNSGAFQGCFKLSGISTFNYPLEGDGIFLGDFAYAVLFPAIDGTGTVALVGYNYTLEKIVIPSEINNLGVKYKVIRITPNGAGDPSYSKLKTLVIGANVQTIDDKAFAGCKELVSVTGGAGLKSVGTRAFANCPKLKVFNITSKALWKIGPFAFALDKNLKTLQIKKTTKLTKSGVKNSLKGSSVKTVKVKKSKVKKYKKIFKKKNCGKRVKIKR